MRVHRRKFLHFAAAATAALPALPRMARAETYPSRPVRIVVGFPPGAATDIIARLVADGLSQRLGQQFIVDNRPGAGSNIGAETAIKAPPDGYTLLAITVTNAVNATLYDNLNFDFAPRHRAGLRHHSLGERARGQSGGPRQDAFPSSSPTPRPIPASSIMRRSAPAPRPTWPPSCSR